MWVHAVLNALKDSRKTRSVHTRVQECAQRVVRHGLSEIKIPVLAIAGRTTFQFTPEINRQSIFH